MRKQRRLSRIVLGISTLLLAACSISPFRFLRSDRATPQPPVRLSRCDDATDVLCVLTFGLEPPDQMLIVLLAAPGLPDELEAEVTNRGNTLPFPCRRTDESPTVIYCTGQQLPLGSTMLIEVYSVEQRALLGSGEFVLTALALPTVFLAELASATPSMPGTVRPSRTPTSGTAIGTPSPRRTTTPARPTRTPLPGTAYPNPTP